MAASGAGDFDSPQVQAAVATTQSKSRPVLLTVPCNVMASPNATCPLKAFSFRAGFEVRIKPGMAASGKLQIPVYSDLMNKSKRRTERLGAWHPKILTMAAFVRWRFGFGLARGIPEGGRFFRRLREFRRCRG